MSTRRQANAVVHIPPHYFITQDQEPTQRSLRPKWRSRIGRARAARAAARHRR